MGPSDPVTIVKCLGSSTVLKSLKIIIYQFIFFVYYKIKKLSCADV